MEDPQCTAGSFAQCKTIQFTVQCTFYFRFCKVYLFQVGQRTTQRSFNLVQNAHRSSIHSTLYIEHDQPQFLAARQRVNYTQRWGADPHITQVRMQTPLLKTALHYIAAACTVCSVQCQWCRVRGVCRPIPPAANLEPTRVAGARWWKHHNNATTRRTKQHTGRRKKIN